MFANPKKSYGPFVGLDFVFMALGLAATLIIVSSAFEPVEAVTAATNPVLAIIGVLVAVVVLSWLAVLGSKLDQRMNDEFTYKAVTNGATASIMVTVLAHLFFDILPVESLGLGGLSSNRLMAIMMGSWAMGYAINRVRGTIA